ncbi:hypothetical protein FQA39_LY02542 [Lamprigera yunnana]|nr:hypothetical protein FQA39_LY02542 [Lamprigera yunnana]
MDNLKGRFLEYVPFSSSVNPSFWHKFTEIKLDIDKLNETERKIWGFYSNIMYPNIRASVFEIDSTSFNLDYVDQCHLSAQGVLINKNTIEQFKECDKNCIAQTEGNKLWDCFKNGEALRNPSLLNRFILLSFADLKKYHYYYWFCFLAPAKLNTTVLNKTLITDVFKEEQMSNIYEMFTSLDIKQRSFFIIRNKGNSLEVSPLSIIENFNSAIALNEYYFVFSDPTASKDYPGWPLRNFLAFLLCNFSTFIQGNIINIVAFRLERKENEINCCSSYIFSVLMPKLKVDDAKISWTGWEKNEGGKFTPRSSNMKNSMDPKCLAETAVDLNLKLMKWQLLPDINLEKIKHSKCLLLGSGTLGCSVARCLLGWGVRHITFLDNASVSFSNPSRQSLFMYEDCLENKFKAVAAAENLQKIFPGVNSKGWNFTIPMPGHSVGETLLSQTKENVQKLKELISTHDVIFLLMDSRESRWLPTLLGTYYQKIVINAALGFDTYLVMRHGYHSSSDLDEELVTSTMEGCKRIDGTKLGCYFCNDVTAPGNSLSKRTLDQQCTVTRPGVSVIAAALAAELSISILQHHQGAKAPAFYRVNNRDFVNDWSAEECLLGMIPHSIRGFLSSYSNLLLTTEKYKQCIACSDVVLAEYQSNGFEFLLKVFNSSKYLEELTGLSDIHKEIQDLEIQDFEDLNESD